MTDWKNIPCVDDSASLTNDTKRCNDAPKPVDKLHFKDVYHASGSNNTRPGFSQSSVLSTGRSCEQEKLVQAPVSATNANKDYPMPSIIRQNDWKEVTESNQICTPNSAPEGTDAPEERSLSKPDDYGTEHQVVPSEHAPGHISIENQNIAANIVNQSTERGQLPEENLPVEVRPSIVEAPLKLWTVDETPEQNLSYTNGCSTFAEGWNGRANILMMMLNQNLMKNMRNSVIAGHRFRELKRAAEIERRSTREERAHLMQAWQDMDNMIALMKVRPPGTRNNQDVPFERLAPEFQQRRDKASSAIAIIDSRILRAEHAAIEAEKFWRAAMRLVDWEHQRLFKDAGAIPCQVEYWKEQDCVFPDGVSPIVHNSREHGPHENMIMERSQHEPTRPQRQEPLRSADRNVYGTQGGRVVAGQCIKSNVNNPTHLNKAAEANLRKSYDELWKPYHDNVNACAYAASEAQSKHDKHRGKYSELLSQYAADHPDLQEDERLDEFTPIFLREGQRRVQAVEDAERTLEETKEEGKAKLAEHSVSKRWNTREERKFDEFIRKMNNDILKSFDRRKIDRWLAKLPREMDLTYNTVEESPDFWLQREFSDLAESRLDDDPQDRLRSEPPQPGSEHEHFPDVPRDRHEALHQEEDSGSNDYRQPHVEDMLGLDSASVMDERYIYRSGIDGLAWEYRDGYY